MVGRHREEIAEYQRAVDLGLTDWTLFLNLGLAYLEQRDFKSAANVLKMAVLLAPERAEPHYNLALAYERLAMLNEPSSVYERPKHRRSRAGRTRRVRARP